MPTPEDPIANQPVWENYVVCQAAAACLGLIPLIVTGVAVAIAGRRVTMHFFSAVEPTAEDLDDMADIADELHVLGGGVLDVSWEHERRNSRVVEPGRIGFRWIFLSRAE